MSTHKEKILCIDEEILFKDGKWDGIKKENLDYYLNILRTEGEFMVRDEVEGNERFKQVIVQAVLRFGNKYFLHKQLPNHGGDLKSLYPLSLGGHVEEKDILGKQDIFSNALFRELNEELDIISLVTKNTILGLIYIENQDIATRTHIGLVSILDLDGDHVHIRENGLEDIGFVTREYLRRNINSLAFWSRVISKQL